MQARALRVPEVCVNHTPPPCLVEYPFTKMEYRVLNTLVLPDPWLTQDGPVTFPACALYQLLSGLAIWHMMANIVHISVPTHIAACFYISLWCLRLSLSVLRWKSIRISDRLLAPLSGITLTVRATHSLHYTLPNSYMMIRSPRLRSHWSPPRRLTALRSQALCPAHSYHTVSSAHMFLRAPLATSQAKQCQLRSVRPSRSSHSLSSYSAATS